MQLLTSPRLPGVPILDLDATGPEYSRWRRRVKFALETKDTWKFCNGALPMPMPAMARLDEQINDTQPSLLEERRAWVRQDREVKLDIFLSLAEEVMLDVFEVGPPLPPTKCTAQQMLEVLDSRFNVFEFEGYHHAFCHFLNLHVDQYASLDEFNKEFLTVLEDLHDYGQPLSNTQACSAYFSKLNCTQNPWVAKKVEEWSAQCSEPQIQDLMQESVLWPYVEPLRSKSSKDYYTKPTLEEHIGGNAGLGPAYSDVAPGLSDTSTLSSKAFHSSQVSESISERQRSTIYLLSKQQFDPQALREALEKVPAIFDSERSSLHESVRTASTTPEWLSAKEDIAPTPKPQSEPEPEPTKVDVSSLLLPPAAIEKSDSKSHTRSHSTPIPATTLKVWVPEQNPPRRPQTADFTFTEAKSALQVVRRAPSLSEHPAFRYKAWAPPGDLTVDIHPALRPMTPSLQLQKPMSKFRSCSPLAHIGSQRANLKRISNRPRALSMGSFDSSHDTTSTVLSGPIFDYSLPPSPTSSSSNSGSSSSSSIVLKLPLQGTDPLPWVESPASSLPSPIALTIPVTLTPETPPLSPQKDREQEPQQKPSPFLSFLTTPNPPRTPPPPISLFSLAPPSLSITTTATPHVDIKPRHKKSIHRRFSSYSSLLDRHSSSATKPITENTKSDEEKENKQDKDKSCKRRRSKSKKKKEKKKKEKKKKKKEEEDNGAGSYKAKLEREKHNRSWSLGVARMARLATGE